VKKERKEGKGKGTDRPKEGRKEGDTAGVGQNAVIFNETIFE
jgi:hypothetical protein